MNIKSIKKNRKSLGFTLIELLVAISIIGILSSILLVSFSNAQKQARDSQRKSDLRQYQNSLELYANKNNGLYPSRTTSSASTTLCTDLGQTGCSEDPRYTEDNSFIYNYDSDGPGGGTAVATDYVLWGKIENATATYWVYCSNGKAGEATSGIPPSNGVCPI